MGAAQVLRKENWSNLFLGACFGGRGICIGRGSVEDLHFRVRQPTRVAAAALVVVREASAGRNQAANDNILLQAPQAIAGAAHGGLGQHAGGFLEGGCGNERFGRQRCLGNAQQHRIVLRGLLVAGLDAHVLLSTRIRSDCSPMR